MARSRNRSVYFSLAVGVGGVREQLVVGADVEHADGEELVALGLGVLVEQHLLVGVEAL